MATVGAVSCDMVKGHAPSKTPRLDVWHRPGVDGPGAQHLGLAGQFEFIAVKYAAYATVLAWAQAIEALVGTVVTIINDNGQTFTGCLITQATPSIAYALSAAGNTRGEVRLRGELT